MRCLKCIFNLIDNPMRRQNYLLIIILIALFKSFGQDANMSIHQEQSHYFREVGITPSDYELINEPSEMPILKNRNCTLNKYVFGWHPYWSNGLQVNYNWNLLSDMSYFSYEVNPLSGNATTTHGFATAQAVTDALADGVRVNLCVTLFSDHATFFGNAAAKQTLINNLIVLIQNRGAHGVNIDFESMASTLSADYTIFMIDLSTQMKAAIPDCQISVALHAVDWSNFYDIPALEPHIDLFCIMGYDYYWAGSSNAGPNDPLYHFNYNAGYNRTLSRSTTYYESRGVPKDKLLLGLPYYGREWPVSSFTLPAVTTGNGQAAFYRTVKNNASGYYDAVNRNIEPISRSVYYNFMDGTTMKQHFIAEEEELGERMDFANKRGLAGIGIWALGYDDGYVELWNEIETHFTDCTADLCSGDIWDIGGGPFTPYYSQEDYSYTISPTGATSISVNFSAFEVENNFDFLYIYDGPSVASPQIAGSPFTGTNSPGAFVSSSGALTFSFTSDNATVAPGFKATYTCEVDNIPPTTLIDVSNDWKTEDFLVDFIDTDNPGGSGIDRRFYHVGHFDGSEWRANSTRGFLNDHFDNQVIHPNWQSFSGMWGISQDALSQTDEASTNTNIYAPLTQSLSNIYLYHYQSKIGGSGGNRRAGFHFFCDDVEASNRGNSYFVWLRADDNAIQFYKVVNDNFGTPVINQPYTINADQWYDVKVSYDRILGDVVIYINDAVVATWKDNAPLVSGDFVSFRSGNAVFEVDDFKVYRTRFPSVTVTVGDLPNADIQYQNEPISQHGGRILSVVRDGALNLSAISSELINVDWTPAMIDYLNDGSGNDLDTIYAAVSGQVDANWSADDVNSGLTEYEFAIGTTPFTDNIHEWTTNGLSETVNAVSQNLAVDVWYYFSLRAINGAGLIDSISSNGFRILVTTIGLENNSFDLPILYPNPVEEQFTISWSNKIEKVEVYDGQGKLVYAINNIDNNKVHLSSSKLSSGTYVARVFSDNSIVDLKFIKK